MQEVFEKGIERLRRFIEDAQSEGDWSYIKPFEKAIEMFNQIAAEYSECNKNCTECEAYDKEKHYCPKFCHVIKETVQEIKENNNNGWIPCSKEMPPQPKANPLLENKPLELYLASVKNTDYPFRVFWNGKYFTDGFSKIEVLAWQPLPEPYDQKGE